MLPAAVISRKRDGLKLTDSEIRGFVSGFTRGTIPDYQMSALAMAVCCRGMDPDETFALTVALLESGETLRRHSADPPRVDKHSTGGIGDKVSLVLAPLIACCGLHVPMISGRGLGATGGTLDKLESIPGFQTQLAADEFEHVVCEVGCVIAGATDSLVPADRKLYALRDVTGTVPSIPLITASIMSKKLAEGLDALVLDVKHGSGAFMKDVDTARCLGTSMQTVGHSFGVPTISLLTDMNQPLGRMVGNAVEVDETLTALEGAGPEDLLEVTLSLGTELLLALNLAKSPAEAGAMLQGHIDSGRARETFARMVSAQGGDLDAPRPIAPVNELASSEAGYISRIDAEALGLAIIELGGGRRRQGDAIDHSVGFEMLVRLGDRIDRSEPLMNVFCSPDQFAAIQPHLRCAIELSDAPPAERPLILPC
ncbi:MAG: thymidine phosphorylase [Planctomycetaceae bacterium]|nr:thymidine phosphorylase [Planctomycetaceae bacterium]